jgi:hypothetical protein
LPRFAYGRPDKTRRRPASPAPTLVPPPRDTRGRDHQPPLGWGPTEIDGINLQRNELFDAGTPVQPDLDRRFTKLVGFSAPRRWLTTETMDVDGMVAEIERVQLIRRNCPWQRASVCL